MLTSIDITREGNTLHNLSGNLARMLDDVRAGGRHGYTSAVVSMTCNAYRNALEAALATISEAETEALLLCHQREANNPVFSWSRIPPRRSGGLPAVVSPCATE